MRHFLMCAALLCTMVIAMAEDALPKDVQRFVARREGCEHMRGEIPDPGEKQRMKEVNREIRKLCTGTDRELARLKQKYKASPAIMRRLDEFEQEIE